MINDTEFSPPSEDVDIESCPIDDMQLEFNLDNEILENELYVFEESF